MQSLELENIDFAGKTEINIINLEDTTKDVQEDEEDNVKTERRSKILF